MNPITIIYDAVNIMLAPLHGVIFEEPFAWLFILVTVIMGGWAAWMTGRACALTWRPSTVLALYLIVLTAGVRFIHFALFQGTLISPHYFLVDLVVIQIIGALGYRYTRAQQMSSKYAWLFEPAGMFGWRPRRS